MVAVKHFSAIAAILTLALCVWTAGVGLDFPHLKPGHHANVTVSAAFGDGSSALLFGPADPAPGKDCCSDDSTCEQCACHFQFLVQAEQAATLSGPGSLLPPSPARHYEEFILGPPIPPPPHLS